MDADVEKRRRTPWEPFLRGASLSRMVGACYFHKDPREGDVEK